MNEKPMVLAGGAEPCCPPDRGLRRLTLEGVYNFRDLGGYLTSDGMQVRRGLVFRSSALTMPTAGDLDFMRRLGIAQVVDLRSSSERSKRPGRLEVPIWWRDHKSDSGDLIQALTSPNISAERCREMMCLTYDRLPEEQADAYAKIFEFIASGRLPLVFHCAVGKDRTGVAAALLLALLGVPRAEVEADYMDTALMADRLVADVRASLEQNGAPPIADTVLQPIIGVDPAYLGSMFDGVQRRYGSLTNYVEKRLGLSANQVADIRRRLLCS